MMKQEGGGNEYQANETGNFGGRPEKDIYEIYSEESDESSSFH
jgi:hypothetical protein